MTAGADEPRTAPLTPERWDDLEELFGPRGAVGGCWCWYWRLPGAEWQARCGEGTRALLRERVEAGPPPGLLAYRDGAPVGWCAVAPRSELQRLQRSPRLGPVDGVPVWAVSCFYIHRRHRRQGVARALLLAAVAHARAAGAPGLEGYPLDDGDGRRISNGAAYTGTLSLFRSAGFQEVARRGPRPIVRRLFRD